MQAFTQTCHTVVMTLNGRQMITFEIYGCNKANGKMCFAFQPYGAAVLVKLIDNHGLKQSSSPFSLIAGAGRDHVKALVVEEGD
jgi:hypothetical protein